LEEMNEEVWVICDWANNLMFSEEFKSEEDAIEFLHENITEDDDIQEYWIREKYEHEETQL